MKRGAVIKDNFGRLICLELQSTVRREVEVEQIGKEEAETAMNNMKKAKR